jgi:hypothetical protein
MFRRSIFLGLMVLLGSMLVYMVLSARRQEKRISSPPTEIIRKSKPSATRVLAPPDLQVTESTTEILPPSAGSGPVSGIVARHSVTVRMARHSVTVRNQGTSHYRGFMLKFDYLAASGSSVETRSHQVSQDLPPGATVRLQDLLMEGLPAKVRRCRVGLAWADLAE